MDGISGTTLRMYARPQAAESKIAPSQGQSRRLVASQSEAGQGSVQRFIADARAQAKAESAGQIEQYRSQVNTMSKRLLYLEAGHRNLFRENESLTQALQAKTSESKDQKGRIRDLLERNAKLEMELNSLRLSQATVGESLPTIEEAPSVRPRQKGFSRFPAAKGAQAS